MQRDIGGKNSEGSMAALPPAHDFMENARGSASIEKEQNARSDCRMQGNASSSYRADNSRIQQTS